MSELVVARLAGADVALIPIAGSRALAIVDAADAPLVAGRSWHLGNGYATTTRSPRVSGAQKIRMHQLILPTPEGLTADHRNLNRLDNRRSNLRPATAAQQQWNRDLDCRNSSGFKGVHPYKKTGQWRAMIRLDGRSRHIGLFDDLTEAAKAYDSAAREHFGEFARVNFPELVDA